MKVVFVGNCNTEEIMRAAHAAMAGDAEFWAKFILRQEASSPEALAEIAACDFIVYQVMDYEVPDAASDLIGNSAKKIIKAPYIAGSFLWPFSSKPHPRNSEGMSAFYPAGPYEAQLGDAQLITLMEKMVGSTADDIIDAYLDLDFNKITPLDRFYEFNKAKYSRLGESCDLNLWPLVEGLMCDRRIFWTFTHPSALLLWPMTRLVLERLGAPPDGITRALKRFGEPLGFVHVPIHPSVLQHFGIRSISADEGYRYFNEGIFTAREYWARFISFQYSEKIPEVITDLHRVGMNAEVHGRLLDLAEHHPRSADVLYQLGAACKLIGRDAEAAPLAIRALKLEPNRREFQELFADVVSDDPLTVASPAVLKCEHRYHVRRVGPAAAALRAGWREPEAWGVWAHADDARLNFTIDDEQSEVRDAAFDVDLDFRIRADRPETVLEIFAEDKMVARWRLKPTDGSESLRGTIQDCPIIRINGDLIVNLRIRVGRSDLMAMPNSKSDAHTFALTAISVRRVERARAAAGRGFFGRADRRRSQIERS